MITNFEEITADLTRDEMELAAHIIDLIGKYSKSYPIKSNGVCEYINQKYRVHTKLNGPRLRKIINYIRISGEAIIIGTSKGYYSTTDKSEIRKQIKSLEERAAAIQGAANGLKKFL